MTPESQFDRALSLNPVATSCFAVAVCAIATSLVGLLIPHFPAGGMAIVGAFYLVIGLFDAVLHPALSDELSGPSATGARIQPSEADALNNADDRANAPHDGAKKAHDRRRDLVEV